MEENTNHISYMLTQKGRQIVFLCDLNETLDLESLHSKVSFKNERLFVQIAFIRQNVG